MISLAVRNACGAPVLRVLARGRLALLDLYALLTQLDTIQAA